MQFGGQQSRTGEERRAPAFWRFRIELDSSELRPQLSRSLAELRDLSPQNRRRVQIVLGQLIAQWLALEGQSGLRSPVFEILCREESIRIDVVAQPPQASVAFWEALVTPRIEELVTFWGIDRRVPAGAWFELHLSEED